jgi:hypothetical protein
VEQKEDWLNCASSVPMTGCVLGVQVYPGCFGTVAYAKVVCKPECIGVRKACCVGDLCATIPGTTKTSVSDP